MYNFKLKIRNKNEKQIKKQLIHLVTNIVPSCTITSPIDAIYTQIKGGITNTLFRLSWNNKNYLIRQYGLNTEDYIDRELDNRIFSALSKAGIAPLYHGRFLNGRIEEWFDSKPLKAEELSQVEPVNFVRLIAKELAKLHLFEMPGSKNPILWEKLELLEKLAKETNFSNNEDRKFFETLELQKLKIQIEWLKSELPSSENNNGEAALEMIDEKNDNHIQKLAIAFATDIVFCHNDVLCANVLWNEDWDRVRLIDYEYGGYNYRGYDLANHFCEYCGYNGDINLYPNEQKQYYFLDCYLLEAAPELYKKLESEKDKDEFIQYLADFTNQFSLVSHLFWGLWSILKAKNSVLPKEDFNFLRYSKIRFDNYQIQKKLFFPDMFIMSPTSSIYSVYSNGGQEGQDWEDK